MLPKEFTLPYQLEQFDKAAFRQYLINATTEMTDKIPAPEELDFYTNLRQKTNPDHLLITLPAMLVGFAVSQVSGGHEGKNIKTDIEEFIKILPHANGTFSPLCAQYEPFQDTAGASSNLLLEHVANSARIPMRWLNTLTAVNRRQNPKFRSILSTLRGDAIHVQSIVPTTVLTYAQKNQLAKMLLLLDRQFNELQQKGQEELGPDTVTDLSLIESETAGFLTDNFGPKWNVSDKRKIETCFDQIETIESQRPLARKEKSVRQILGITLEETLPYMMRFYGDTAKLRNHFSENVANLTDDLNNLTPGEFSEWCHLKGWPENHNLTLQHLTEVRQEIIKQGLITPAGRALHEVVLYFMMGLYCQQNNFVGVGLDVDHTRWMQLSWRLGYNHGRDQDQIKPVPILYARKNKSGNQTNQLSSFSLREEWI